MSVGGENRLWVEILRVARRPAVGLLAYFIGLLAASAAYAGSDMDRGRHVAPVSQDGSDWPQDGGLAGEQHYSPLRQIDQRNVSRLGLAWYYDLPLGLASSTPLEVGGVLYTATGYSVLRAFDAASGKLLWQYDPQVARVAGLRLRMNWGIRGLAYDDGRIFVGTADGRLIAVTAATGQLIWSQITLKPEESTTSITGAPRVFNGKVLIGQAGADVGPVRGYVTAYEAATGKQIWRFYTVPGNPAKGFENEAMAMAAKTWAGEWWKFGGGGTAWNALTYDPDFNVVYIGVGNGGPWDRRIRSAGQGDNLFLASIVALDADTGAYRWHYQVNPGECWDYSDAMDIELATLTIGGKPRKVLLHAPKNGFFYVIDRQTGKLISVEPFAKVNWASRIDLKTGRPIEMPGIRYENGPATLWPGSAGAHSAQAMSFSPLTGLAYIPARDLATRFDNVGVDPKTWQYHIGPVGINLGANISGADQPPGLSISSLLAWDPVGQRKIWSVPMTGVFNGGTLATAGGLVFQGRADGRFVAYAADTGKELWSFEGGAGIVGTPISYRVAGNQYVTLLVGYGGPATMFGPGSAQFGWQARTQPRRILTFAIDGDVKLPTSPESQLLIAADPEFHPDAERTNSGEATFGQYCIACHGAVAVAAGQAPDLRASPIRLSAEAFAGVVTNGTLLQGGMPKFDDLTSEQVEDLRQYIRKRALDPQGPTVQ
jgi:quinohemoprotein ethanol dehydrogenase